MIYRTALQAAVIISYEDVINLASNPYILDELAKIINQLTGAIIIYTYPLVNMVQRILEEAYA